MPTAFAPCCHGRQAVYPVLRKTDGSPRRNGAVPRLRHRERTALSGSTLPCRCAVSTGSTGKVPSKWNRVTDDILPVCGNGSDGPCPAEWLQPRNLSRFAIPRYIRSALQRKVLGTCVSRRGTLCTDRQACLGVPPVICRSDRRMTGM